MCLKRLCMWLFPKGEMASLRSEFVAGKSALPDPEFLAQLRCGEPMTGRVLVLVRRVIAEACGIAPEMIHPSDQLVLLRRIMDWGSPCRLDVDFRCFSPDVFALDFLLKYERDTGTKLDYRVMNFQDELPLFAQGESPIVACLFGPSPRPDTFGDWAMGAAEAIVKYLPSAGTNAKDAANG